MTKRIIKFRAWDGERMIYPPEGYIFESTVIGNDFPGGITVNKMGRKQIELMQFTGKTDPNSLEIYQGDLIKVTMCNDGYGKKRKTRDFIMPVVWNENECGFDVEWPQDIGEYDVMHGNFWLYPKLGNVYEHPYLLKYQPV